MISGYPAYLEEGRAVKTTIIYENLPFDDRKWVRITKTDEGRIISRTRHHTKEAAEQGGQHAANDANEAKA